MKPFLNFLLLLSCHSLSHGALYISEAYPNPCGQEGVNGANEGREWFEITNSDAVGFTMDGYTIADNTTNSTTANRFRIGNLTIPAGGTVVFSGLPLATFNSIFSTNLSTANYYEIPGSPVWASGGGTSGMSNTGWMNNAAGDNIRIFTDAAATVELTGAYRPANNFPGTSNGQSFYWDGASSDWTLNPTGGSPAGFEASDPGCPFHASPGTTGPSIPEPSATLLTSGLLIGLAWTRRRN